ncbi:MAG: hypothetical protein RSB36_07575, partial [Hydrogenoanaerobacterium sp.]
MPSAIEYWVWLGMAFGSADAKTDEIIRSCDDLAYLLDGGCEVQLTNALRERLHSVKLDDAKRIV